MPMPNSPLNDMPFPLPPAGNISLIYNGVGYYYFTHEALLAAGVPESAIPHVPVTPPPVLGA